MLDDGCRSSWLHPERRYDRAKLRDFPLLTGRKAKEDFIIKHQMSLVIGIRLERDRGGPFSVFSSLQLWTSWDICCSRWIHRLFLGSWGFVHVCCRIHRSITENDSMELFLGLFGNYICLLRVSSNSSGMGYLIFVLVLLLKAPINETLAPCSSTSFWFR